MCLEGTTKNDLQNILDYIYHGEVQIFQDNLNRFLNIAQRLLEESNEQHSEEEKVEHTFKDHELEPQIEVKRGYDQLRRTIVKDVALFKNEGTIPMSTEAGTNEKINESFEKVSTGVFKCKICGKISKQSVNIKQHIETHLEGLSYPCHQCGKTFRSANVLRSHITQKHK